MKRETFSKVVLCCSLLTLVLLAVPAAAQPPRGRGMFGDWQIKVPFGERQMDVILSFTRDAEGNWGGQWIGWAMNELKDVKFEDGNLSFVHTARFGDNEFTSTFKGKIEEGKLTGVLSRDRGDVDVTGQRAPRTPRAVGNWEMKFTIGDRDVTTNLIISANEDRQLAAEWKSQWGEHEITDLAYERRNLSFKRKSKFQDREFESTFEGTFEGDTLVGTIKSEMGDVEAKGTRVGGAAIGTWNLAVTAEWGTVKQRFRVNPDMTGTYGTIPVKKVELKDDQLSFGMVVPFRDQQFEMNFAGKIQDGKLTGEMTTSRGTQKITGTKVVRPMRRRPNM
ncbi:MAG: hypothetical protein JSW27_04935 [Phycisphaerales bacterium]|nr:MAG: hypothetical protein JSW27_04935 [Phycisphaerales bacterium]